LDQLDASISAIEEAPDRWQVVDGDLRRDLMRQFPYGLYYRLAGDELRILVVKHHSRHPDYWKHRVDE